MTLLLQHKQANIPGHLVPVNMQSITYVSTANIISVRSCSCRQHCCSLGNQCHYILRSLFYICIVRQWIVQSNRQRRHR